MKKSIVILASRGVPADVTRLLRRELPAVFGLPARTATIPGPPREAFNEMRGQYDAIAIIAAMLRGAPAGAEKTLMVIQEDLFIPVMTHVIGEAQLGGVAGVLSLHRLAGNAPEGRDPAYALRKRALKEAVHELGHTFGLTHCRDFLCPMSISSNVGQVDRKSARPCAACAFLLGGGGEARAEARKPVESRRKRVMRNV